MSRRTASLTSILLLLLALLVQPSFAQPADALWLEPTPLQMNAAREPESVIVHGLGPQVWLTVERVSSDLPLRVLVRASSSLAGQTLQVTAGPATAAGKLAIHPTTKLIEFETHLPQTPGQREVAVQIDGQTLAQATLPAAPLLQKQALAGAALEPWTFVFAGDAFPPVGYKRASLAANILGEHTTSVQYFDQKGRPATAPERVGPYAAVATVKPTAGPSFQRFFTLYRTARELDWRAHDSGITVELPEGLGINAGVLIEQNHILASYLQQQLARSLRDDPLAARMLAGLYDIEPGSGRTLFHQDPAARNRQWWVDLKHSLPNAIKPATIERPTANPDGLATLLEEGTPDDAGMKKQVADELDELCMQWVRKTEEALTICVARKGVVFFHAGFGSRGSSVVRSDARSSYGSITKLITATAMMMLVDQGLVDLDQPVATYLPALAATQGANPLTVRQLFNHTSGLWGDFGDQMPDLEQVIARYQPELTPGQQFAYNGTGYALAGKIIEAVSGQALPQFYRQRLLEPLGCESIEIRGCIADATGSAIDLARLGQLLLNQGAYSQQRYFSPETFTQMLPTEVAPGLPWGLGLVPATEEGLGEGSFGHPSGTGTILRIDPVNDLVIVVTRNHPGADFEAFKQQLIQIVTRNINTGGANTFDLLDPGF